MRNLSPTALTKITSKFGNAPINILEVQWVSGSSSWYADKTIPQAIGRILEIGSLDDVVSLDQVGSSQTIEIKLDDTDGAIKNVFNSYDLHLQPAKIWQWFEGLDWTDKFLVFSGQICTPISWNEHDRTLTFSVINQLQDQEIGFSAEEGEFPWVPADLVGSPWPMAFGTVLDYPALQITKAIKGVLTTGVGIVSGTNNIGTWAANNQQVDTDTAETDEPDTRVAEIQLDFLKQCADAYSVAADFLSSRIPKTADQYTKKASEIDDQISKVEQQIQDQYDKWATQQDDRRKQQQQAQARASCRATSHAAKSKSEASKGSGPDVVQIIGGEDFPQNVTLTLNIGGGLFTGSFSGATGTDPTGTALFTITSRYHPDNQDKANEDAGSSFSPGCPTEDSIVADDAPEDSYVQIGGQLIPTPFSDPGAGIHFHFEMQIPVMQGAVVIISGGGGGSSGSGGGGGGGGSSGSGGGGGGSIVDNRKLVMGTIVADGILPSAQKDKAHKNHSGGGHPDTSSSYTPQSFWADPGTNVTIASDESLTYIASIVPGTILSVKAYKQPPGQARVLTALPTNYYTVKTVNYGAVNPNSRYPVTAVQIILTRPLSSYVDFPTYIINSDGTITLNNNLTDQLAQAQALTPTADLEADTSEGWEDTLYVTFHSSVGPNIVDILIYLIQQYTSLRWDTASFNVVKTKLANFPANFPILDRKNIIQVLNEIAFQARCALYLKDRVFFIKYIAEEPTVDSIITLNDIDFETGIEVDLTTASTSTSASTEDIVTKDTVNWHMTWDEDSENHIILRHNVKKYGLFEESYDMYIYNQPDIVYKVATFWMIRKSNTWKRVKFSTFLQKLNIETFDTVLLNFGDKKYVSNDPVKAIVMSAQYNSDKYTIDFECLTPLKSGTMTPYPFFWPASLPPGTKFPTAQEIAEGYAGGAGFETFAVGILPVGYVPTTPGVIFIGGTNIGFGPHADYGDRNPTDVGFVPKAVMISNPFYSPVGRPKFNASLPHIDPETIMLSPFDKLDLAPIPAGVFNDYIDLHNTDVYDPNTQALSTLDTFFKKIDPDTNYLLGDTLAYWDDDTNTPTNFDFRYDEEGQQFGAGTAFLQPDNSGGGGGGGPSGSSGAGP